MRFIDARMRRRLVRLALLIAVASAALVATGCATLVSGRGQIPSVAGGLIRGQGKAATFSMLYQRVDAQTGSGTLSGTYHDPYAPGGPVKIRFNGLDFSFPPGLGSDKCGFGFGEYVSADRTKPGGGLVGVTPCDGDHVLLNLSSQDSLGIVVLSGPYAGYSNFGFVSGGDLTAG